MTEVTSLVLPLLLVLFDNPNMFFSLVLRLSVIIMTNSSKKQQENYYFLKNYIKNPSGFNIYDYYSFYLNTLYVKMIREKIPISL